MCVWKERERDIALVYSPADSLQPICSILDLNDWSISFKTALERLTIKVIRKNTMSRREEAH